MNDAYGYLFASCSYSISCDFVLYGGFLGVYHCGCLPFILISAHALGELWIVPLSLPLFSSDYRTTVYTLFLLFLAWVGFVTLLYCFLLGLGVGRGSISFFHLLII